MLLNIIYTHTYMNRIWSNWIWSIFKEKKKKGNEIKFKLKAKEKQFRCLYRYTGIKLIWWTKCDRNPFALLTNIKLDASVTHWHTHKLLIEWRAMSEPRTEECHCYVSQFNLASNCMFWIHENQKKEELMIYHREEREDFYTLSIGIDLIQKMLIITYNQSVTIAQFAIDANNYTFWFIDANWIGVWCVCACIWVNSNKIN